MEGGEGGEGEREGRSDDGREGGRERGKEGGKEGRKGSCLLAVFKMSGTPRNKDSYRCLQFLKTKSGGRKRKRKNC